jgi:hypothetical protein
LAQDRLRLEERAKIAGQPQVAHAYVDNANRKAETAKHHGVVRPPPMPRLRHCFPQRSGPSHHPSNGDGGRYQRAIKLEYGGCLLKTCESMQDHGLRELCAFEINQCQRSPKIKRCNHQRTLLYLDFSRNYENLRQYRSDYRPDRLVIPKDVFYSLEI